MSTVVRRPARALGPLVLALALLAVVPPAASHASSTVDVTLTADGFVPSSIEIQAGQTVRWSVQAVGSHEVRALDGSWSSGPLLTGMTWSRTFETAGTHGYHDPSGCTTADCTGPTGSVVVTAPAEPEPEPEPSPTSSPTASSSDRHAASSSEPEPSVAPDPVIAPASEDTTASGTAAPRSEPEQRAPSGPQQAPPLYLGAGLPDGEATAVQPPTRYLDPRVAAPRSVTGRSYRPTALIGPVASTTSGTGPPVEPVRIAAAAIASVVLGLAVRRRLSGPALLDPTP